ncbi:HAD family phosphatase [Clostridium sp. K12(2020)]|nr:HAD family phosphatase [Clostridium sp. K12(2020)]MBX9144432.1 HAD family phosphatase [Clostridium sp. K13]
MSKIKAVIFDMDGVIFDTEMVYLSVWSEVFEKYGYKMTKDWC